LTHPARRHAHIVVGHMRADRLIDPDQVRPALPLMRIAATDVNRQVPRALEKVA
jgi:hypothetical protein